MRGCRQYVWYIQKTLQPAVMQFMSCIPEDIIQQDNTELLTTNIAQVCPPPISFITFPGPETSLNVSLVEHQWDI